MPMDGGSQYLLHGLVADLRGGRAWGGLASAQLEGLVSADVRRALPRRQEEWPPWILGVVIPFGLIDAPQRQQALHHPWPAQHAPPLLHSLQLDCGQRLVDSRPLLRHAECTEMHCMLNPCTCNHACCDSEWNYRARAFGRGVSSVGTCLSSRPVLSMSAEENIADVGNSSFWRVSMKFTVFSLDRMTSSVVLFVSWSSYICGAVNRSTL